MNLTFDVGGTRTVHRLGFGAMHLHTAPGPGRDEAIDVLRHAVDLGVDLIDTALLYGGGANEELIADALHPYPDGLLIATKVGADPALPGAICGRPEVLRAQVDGALRRLRVDRLELLQLHRVDPDVPLADQVGTLAALRAAGKIVHIGLSEVTVAQLAEARGITAVASVQNRYNLLERHYDDVLDACTEAGIAFLPWRPVHAPGRDDAPVIGAVAREIGATAAQVMLSWLLRRSPVVLPIPGTAGRQHLAENLAAQHLPLDDEQFRRLDALTG
ncbi:oxidoreductase [Virgisporangium aliadipatigenens]|uniref:Oxidoreductase n=1 Tax=Virgisporangium aliadipatigenens TaxID=741659 RepID=A0A8J3YMK8_9ACTN|nr:aldo/keto reductase [Virgisporangium aliadipatigenens]GIJ48289.1 oxidoreductase [Virgisporangium aliadipatigenens]